MAVFQLSEQSVVQTEVSIYMYLVFNRDRYLERNYVIYPHFNFSTWFPCCVLSWLTLFSCLSFLPFVMVWVFTLAIYSYAFKNVHTLYVQTTYHSFILFNIKINHSLSADFQNIYRNIAQWQPWYSTVDDVKGSLQDWLDMTNKVFVHVNFDDVQKYEIDLPRIVLF